MENGRLLTLYDTPTSPCARRVRITLLEKGLPYRTVLLDLTRLEQKRPEYLRLNPNGVVPTLVHGDRIIYESNVITQYLDDVFPQIPLYPDDPGERVEVARWQSFELSLATDYRPMFYQRLIGPSVRLRHSLEEALETARRSTTNAFDLEWERKVWGLSVLTPDEEEHHAKRLYERIEILERALEGRSYLVGDRFGQAEISVFPRVRMFPQIQLPIDRARFPNVAGWMKRLEARPSFDRSLYSAERRLRFVSSNGILAWASARLKRPRESWTLAERLGLWVLRQGGRHGNFEGTRAGAAPRTMPPLRRVSLPPAPAPRRRVEPPAERAGLTLYYAQDSPCSRRIEILLDRLDLSVDRVALDLAKMEHKRRSLVALQPQGEVPVLVHGPRVLQGSSLIAFYLNAVFGPSDLFPIDAFERAQVAMWIAYEQAFQKEWRPLIYQTLFGRTWQGREQELDQLGRTGELIAGASDWLRRAALGQLLSSEQVALYRAELIRKLGRIESGLQGCDCLVGDRLTFADIAVFTRLDLFERLGMPIGPHAFPRITVWMNRIRPSCGRLFNQSSSSTAQRIDQ